MPSNLRLTTHECVHLVTRMVGTPFDPPIIVHANFTAHVLEKRSYRR